MSAAASRPRKTAVSVTFHAIGGLWAGPYLHEVMALSHEDAAWGVDTARKGGLTYSEPEATKALGLSLDFLHEHLDG